MSSVSCWGEWCQSRGRLISTQACEKADGLFTVATISSPPALSTLRMVPRELAEEPQAKAIVSSREDLTSSSGAKPSRFLIATSEVCRDEEKDACVSARRGGFLNGPVARLRDGDRGDA